MFGDFFSNCGITNLLLPQTGAYQEQSSRLTAMHPKQGAALLAELKIPERLSPLKLFHLQTVSFCMKIT